MDYVDYNGVKISVFKYKVRIFDPENRITKAQAHKIASYLFKEGFISKQEFPVEIIQNWDE